MAALDVYKIRMKDRFWGLKETVSNKQRIRENDPAIFYSAGKEGQKFLGTCLLASRYHELTKSDYKKMCHAPFFMAKYGVNLKEIEIWETPISIRPLLKRLSLTKPFLPNWGRALRGSIISLPERDCKIIIGSEAFSEIQKNSREVPELTNDEKNYTNSKRKALDVTFQTKVRTNYGFSCAVCGRKRANRFGHYEVQSCHIYPREKNGSNDLEMELECADFTIGHLITDSSQ
jgi:hypothetical protein